VGILNNIAEVKRKEVAHLKRDRLLSSLKDGALSQHPPLDFKAAIRREGRISLIAELKMASPSRGVLRKDFDVPVLARDYARGGAQALSVLTDEGFFRGSLANLQAARQATDLPVLRKDFIIDEWQVWEAREAGADAVLLIAALLPLGRLRELQDLVHELGMSALVEVHNEREMDAARAAECPLIGINNRDLDTFAVDTGVTLRLLPRCPSGATVVSESGIRTRADVQRLKESGVHAVLVGESLITKPDLAAAVRELMPEAGS
jgi:indole-3-glycerol phosphate synthase